MFFATALALWWLVAHRLTIINDEGLYLFGGEHLMHGEFPYRDFFALTGPGVYWNVALLFRLFGVSLAVGRALLIADLALIAACIYWLTSKLHSHALGLWLTAFYLAILSADAGGLVINHRWDSGALLFLATCFFHHGLCSERRWTFLAAGAAAAYAAWITPPVLLILMVMMAWTLVQKHFAATAMLASGVAAVSAAAAGILVATGTWRPMLDHLVWTTSQYSSANRFPYGGIVGGYNAIFADAGGVEMVVRAVLVFFVILPAIVPVCAVVGCVLWPRLRRPPELALVLCAVAAVATCAPRMDVAHLTYAAPLSYVLSAYVIAWALPKRVSMPLAVAFSMMAATFAMNTLHERFTLNRMTGRVGMLIGPAGDISLARDLERSVGTRERFFAFPYLPLAYFLTQARNASRYPYLQPGMMSDRDEQIALGDLMAAPPDKVLYQDVTPAAYLRLFPSSDPARLRMRRIEDWLRENYQPDPAFAHAHPGYGLLTPRVQKQRLEATARSAG